MFPLVRKHCCGGEKKERLRKASACKRQKEVGCFERDAEVTLLCTRQTVTSLWCVPPFSSLILIERRSPHESFQSHLSPPSSHAPALDKCRCILVYPSCSVSRVSKVERLWGCHSAKKPQQKSSVTPGMQRGRARLHVSSCASQTPALGPAPALAEEAASPSCPSPSQEAKDPCALAEQTPSLKREGGGQLWGPEGLLCQEAGPGESPAAGAQC